MALFGEPFFSLSKLAVEKAENNCPQKHNEKSKIFLYVSGFLRVIISGGHSPQHLVMVGYGEPLKTMKEIK
jgi:hypothetical protein